MSIAKRLVGPDVGHLKVVRRFVIIGVPLALTRGQFSMHAINPYQSPEASPAAEEPEMGGSPAGFRSARPWGMVACAGIGLTALLAAVEIVLALALLSLYRVGDPEQVDGAMEQWLLDRINGAFVTMLVLRLATAVPFLVWFYRSYANLLSLGHAAVDFKPFVAPVCWFVPIFNFIAPCLIMRELRWRSDPDAERLGKANPALQAVNLWWGAWIAGIVLGWFGNRLDYSATTIGDYVLATRCDIATMVVLMVCAVLAVWVIISIDGLQLRRLAQLEAPQAALHRVADSE